MKRNIAPIPKGKVAAPKQNHLHLAQMFHRLAGIHLSKAMANSPDKAVATLPKPDKAALNARQPGGYQGRQPVIGTPNQP